MAKASINSVFVSTKSPETDDDDVIGYELLRVENKFSVPIIKKHSEPEFEGEHTVLISSESKFPDDVQNTMKPYFDRADLYHRLNPDPSSAESVGIEEVRVHIESPQGDAYLIQKRPSISHYITKDGEPVREPPRLINKKINDVFPDYDPKNI